MNTNKELSIKEVKELVKEYNARTVVRFEMGEFTADVNNLIKQGFDVADALNIVGLKTMIDYASYWQDANSLYDIEVDETYPSAERIGSWTQDIIDNVTYQLGELLLDVGDIFASAHVKEASAVGGAN